MARTMTRSMFPTGPRAPGGPPLDGLVLRMESADIVGKSDGETVAAADWPDQSGLGNGPVSGVGGVYKAAQINGLAAVRFAGTNYYQCAAANPTTTFTHVLVFKPTDHATNDVLLGGSDVDTLYADFISAGILPYVSYPHDNGWLNSSVSTTAGAWTAMQMMARRGVSAFPNAPEEAILHLLANGEYAGMSGFPNDPLTATALFIGALNATPTNPYTGDLAAVFIYDRALSAAKTNALNAYLDSRYGLALKADWVKQIVTVGDSIAGGSEAGNGSGFAAQIAAHFAPSDVYSLGFGIGYMGVQDLIDEAATIDALLSAGMTNVLQVFVGTNDIVLRSRTGAATYADLSAYCAARRSAGWKVVVSTVLPRSTGQSEIDALNTSIRANWATFADALVDAAADASLDDNTDTNFFNADAVHPNTAGHGVLYGLFSTATGGVL